MFYGQALVVFLLSLVLSSLWALYFRYAAERRPFAAANVDVLLVTASIALTLAYVHDWRLIPVQLAAAWLGTYLTVRKR